MNAPKLTDVQWLREQLQVGFDEADRGQLAKWDLDRFLAKMHRRHTQLNSLGETDETYTT